MPTDFGSKARVDSFRNAPSFRTVERDVFKDVKHIPKPYNAESIAEFLGWMSGRPITTAITRRLVAEVDGAVGIGYLDRRLKLLSTHDQSNV